MATQSSPTLVQLAERILQNAKKIEAALPATPSIHDDTTVHLPGSLIPTQKATCDDLDKLRDLIGGYNHLYGRMARYVGSGYMNAFCWHVIYHFRVPQAVPVKGQISFAELASKVGVDTDQLQRVLRVAMTMHVFYEPEPGYVAHTFDSRLCVDKPEWFEMIGYWMLEPRQAAGRMVEAMEKWPGAQEANETAANLVFNTDKTYYEALTESPARTRRIGMAMTQFSTGSAEAAKGLALEYPWNSVKEGKGTLVDVGGGNGHISMAIAEQHPDMVFVVQDLPHAVQHAVVPEPLKNRLTFMAHDYTQKQPIPDADFYFFSMVFHNQSDKYVRLLLQQLIPALKPGAKVLWCDRVVPERGSVPEVDYKECLNVDLVMMVLLNAKERSVAQEVELFGEADPRFKHTGTYALGRGSQFTITEATWTP